MTISSADPNRLDDFATTSRPGRLAATGSVEAANQLAARVMAACAGRGLSATNLPAALDLFANMEANEAYVSGIADALRAADTHGGTAGVVSAADADISLHVQNSGADTDLHDITIDMVELLGAPPNSGFVDDPICAANGNFIHTDLDLVFPGTSASLDVERHYNSVAADTVGAFGSGWSSIFDVRLTVAEQRVDAHLADGGIVTFDRRADAALDGWTWTTSHRRHLHLASDTRDDAGGWTLSGGADRRLAWHFDRTGRLTGWRVGRSDVRVARDRAGRIASVTERRSGRTITVDWDGARITALRSDDGRSATYTYGDGETLTRAETNVGWFDYAYDGRLMLTAHDPDGITQFVNRYDDRGRVLEQTSPFGRITTYGYEPGGITTITDQHGVRQAMVHDRRGNLTAVVDTDGSSMRITYDAHDRAVHIVDRSGAEWRHVFDDAGELIGRIDPDGLAQSWSWDGDGRKLTETDRAGNTITFEYEGDHRTPSLVTGPDGSMATVELDDADLPTRVTDPDGVVTSFEWDRDGQLVATTDALGNRSTNEFTPTGLLARVIDPLGIATEIDHDHTGRTIGLRRADGHQRRLLTAAGREIGGTDPTGVVWSATIGTHGAVETLTDASGATAHYRYDIVGNVTEIVAADGETFTQEFDEVGRLVAVTDPSGATAHRAYDADGHLVEAVDAEGRAMRRTVDAWGRTTSSTDPTGAVTRWTYHPTGEIATVTLPDGRLWRTEVDTWGRVVAVTDPTGARASREYSPAGRLRSRTSPMGRTEAYEYDAAGRCIATVGVDGVRREVELDAAGRPVALIATDPDRRIVAELGFEWNAGGHLVARRTAGGAHRVERDAAGRVLAEIDPTGVTTRFGYDERGLLATAIDPAGGASRFVHDSRGRLVAQTMPGDRTTTWSYDGTGHVDGMVDPAGVVTEWTRDATGIPTTMRRGDDGWTRRLDAAGREIERRSDDGTLLRRYEYDAVGRMTAAISPSDLIAGGTEHVTEFLWDGADRIRTSTTPDGASTIERDLDGWATAFVDQSGRRTTIERDAHHRIVALHDDEAGSIHAVRTPTADPAAPEFDPAGRLLVARDGTLHRYDDAGRLAERVDPDGTATAFEYDADGLLVAERSRHAVRRFAHDEAGRVVAITVVGIGTTAIEYDDAGRRVHEVHPDGTRTEYGWDALDRLVELRSIDLDGDVRTVRIDADGLGRPCNVDGTPIAYAAWSSRPSLVGDARILEAGGVAWDSVDRAWVERRPGAGIGIGGVEVLGARVLDRSTHQFLSSDPLLPVPGSNGAASAYTYAWQDPINHVDPSGLRPISLEEYAAIRQREEQGRLGQAWEAIKDDPWGTIAVVGLVGVATVVGGPIGAGIAIGMVASAGIGLATGNFSPTQVAIGGVVGGVTGGVGAWTSSSTAIMATGGVTGAGTDLASQYFSGQPIDWRSVGVSGGVGAVTAGIGGATSTATSTTVRSVVAGGVTDAGADVAYQVLTGDHTVDWNSVWVSGVTGGVTSGVSHHLTADPGAQPGAANEIYYRTMSPDHHVQLDATGRLPATSETFITPDRDYALNYDGHTIEFEVEAGTTSQLEAIGVRDTSNHTATTYPDMPVVASGWTRESAFFKWEGEVLNIGLGRGPALDTFNDNIVTTTEVER